MSFLALTKTPNPGISHMISQSIGKKPVSLARPSCNANSRQASPMYRASEQIAETLSGIHLPRCRDHTLSTGRRTTVHYHEAF